MLIKKAEKSGKEQYADYLPKAFEESKELIEKAKKQRKEAESSMRVIRLMTPVLVIVLAIAVIFLVNAYHPFIKVSVEGVALIAGGLFSTYLGWALGMIFRGLKDQMSEKDSKLCSRVFMISFMGTGIILVASGVRVLLTKSPSGFCSFIYGP